MHFIPGLDDYTKKARIQPAILVTVPTVILSFILVPNDSLLWGTFLAILAAGGGATLLSQVARDLGRNREPLLWASWGGAPTTQLLRAQGAEQRENASRWRSKIEQLATFALPSDNEEITNPDGSDRRYSEAVSVLRATTRDATKFSLVFEENCNYGFRRNLWGMKPLALPIAASSALCCWVLAVVGGGLHNVDAWGLSLIEEPDPVLAIRTAGAVANTCISLVWIFVIKPGWVKTAAFAYAQRLLESLDSPNMVPHSGVEVHRHQS